MKTRTIIAVLVAAAVFPAATSLADDGYGSPRLHRQIERCVDRIGGNADYAEARRIVHTITGLKQINLEELEIVVDTEVIGSDRQTKLRSYRTACVTETSGRVTGFRMRAAD